MQTVSEYYKSMVRRDVMEPVGATVTVGLIDSTAAAEANISTDDNMYYSRTEELLTGPAPEQSYTTWEPDRWICGGKGILPSRTPRVRQGYVSRCQAGLDGMFADEPGLHITLPRVFTISGLTIVFDTTHDDWPEQIRIFATRGGAVVTDEFAYPDSAEWGWGGVIGAVDTIDITFIKARYPGRRARILPVLLFGDGIVFNADKLVRVHCAREVDPITRRLPTQEFDFAIENLNREYDPENPKGVWNKLLDRNAVNVDINQTIIRPMQWKDLSAKKWQNLRSKTWGDLGAGAKDNEIVPTGLCYLTSRSTVRDDLAEFPCLDMLSLVSETYYKGPLGGGTLYDLAEAILLDANLPSTTAGIQPWKLWTGLREILTKAPLPIETGKNLLELIAHAACCVIYVDRQGYICIEPADSTQHERYLDFGTMTQRPTITKIEALNRVGTRAYTYNVPKDAAREIHEETYSVSGSLEVHVEFGVACSNVTARVNRGSVTGTVYARAWVGTITGSGDIVLTLTGKRIEETYTIVNAHVARPGLNAVAEEVNNPLITDTAQAKRVAEWVREYLMLRNTYEATDRGYPELDPLDMLYLQSDYSKKLAGRLLRYEWNLDADSALAGKFIIKGYE